MSTKVLLLSLIFAGCLASVADLTATSFDDHIAAHKASGVLVKFFAPWCGHCKALAPEYDKAAEKLAKGSLAKVDCTQHQDLCQKYGIQGYPTLKFFKGEGVSDYQGPRDAAGIEKWVKKKSQPPATLKDKDSLETFVHGNSAVLAFFKEENKETANYRHWEQIRGAAGFEDFEFAETTSRDLYDIEDLTPDKDYIRVYTADGKKTFSGSFEEGLDWLEENAFPLVTELTQNRFPKLAAKKKFVVVLFTGDNKDDEIKTVTKVGQQFSGDLGYVCGHGPNYAQHASMLGITGKKFPVLVGIKQDKYFPMDEEQEFNEENIKTFLSSLATGTVKAHFKSEPIPEKQEAVVKIVGHTFDEIVLKSDKDVFVEFYAPWCGHCKALAPIWQKLAEKYADQSDIVIANLDATANDHPVQGIQGFPTIKFFKKGSKDTPVDYSGGRTLDALSEFIEANRSHKSDKSEL